MLVLPLLLSACATTSETSTSKLVDEYITESEMLDRNTCAKIGDVYANYSILLHMPSARRNAGHVALKEAAYAKGANAVILTTQVAVYGQIEDQVKGIAYNCKPKRPTH